MEATFARLKERTRGSVENYRPADRAIPSVERISPRIRSNARPGLICPAAQHRHLGDTISALLTLLSLPTLVRERTCIHVCVPTYIYARPRKIFASFPANTQRAHRRLFSRWALTWTRRQRLRGRHENYLCGVADYLCGVAGGTTM